MGGDGNLHIYTYSPQIFYRKPFGLQVGRKMGEMIGRTVGDNRIFIRKLRHSSTTHYPLAFLPLPFCRSATSSHLTGNHVLYRHTGSNRNQRYVQRPLSLVYMVHVLVCTCERVGVVVAVKGVIGVS